MNSELSKKQTKSSEQKNNDSEKTHDLSLRRVEDEVIPNRICLAIL